MTAVFRGRGLLSLVAAGLLVGCASAGGAPGKVAAEPGAAATDRSACAGDCTLRVENRLDVDVVVSTERLPALPALGVVRSNRSETFELSDFHGAELQIWVRDDRTLEFVDAACIRRFPRGTGRMIVGSEVHTAGCGTS